MFREHQLLIRHMIREYYRLIIRFPLVRILFFFSFLTSPTTYLSMV